MDFEGNGWFQIINFEKLQLTILYKIYNYNLNYLLDQYKVLTLELKVLEILTLNTVSKKLHSRIFYLILV